jgi:hypothetical protein
MPPPAGPPTARDWLGVQYYRKQWVDPAAPTFFADPPDGFATTQMGWATYPDGLRQMLHRAAKTGLPPTRKDRFMRLMRVGAALVALTTMLMTVACAGMSPLPAARDKPKTPAVGGWRG